jgi:ligand-binding sensor domain-containing protein
VEKLISLIYLCISKFSFIFIAIAQRIKNKILIQYLISIFLFVTFSCSENPVTSVSPGGETCEGSNGTISSSGRWQEFNTSNSCLPSNKIWCLEIDHNNNLWIGTDNGLVFYDGKKWTIYNTSNSKIPFNIVLSLACEDDIVWIGGGGGLAKFDGLSWTIYNSTNSPLGNPPGIIGFTILALNVDSKHNLWIGTNYWGLYKFDKSNWTNRFNISAVTISSIAIDRQDIIWIGYGDLDGVDRFDGTNSVNYTPDNSPLPAWTVLDVHIDKNNIKWFASYNGLARFDDTNWTIYNIDVRCITSDSKNTLWSATSVGLTAKYNNDWKIFYVNDAQEPIYRTPFCIKSDLYDNIWFGTLEDGLYMFNENGIKN